jgi:hypothetical protein
MGRTYPNSLSLKDHIRIKHVRILFEGMSQLGGANMAPRAVSYLFEAVGAGYPIKFSHSSHQVPIKMLLFPWLWRIGR